MPTARRTRTKTEPATEEQHVARTASRDWVRLGDVQVNPLVQREFVPAKADEMAANFDMESFGLPVVNRRGGHAFVIDGQHRIAALRIWLGEGWQDQHFEAEVYTDLTEAEEAEAFLRRNNAMSVNTFSKFRIAVVAGREDELAVETIVRREGLSITRERSAEGRVMAVGSLLRIYRRAGGVVLGRTLAIIRDAYGDAGLEALVLNGMSQVVHRYDELNDKELIDRLGRAHGGVSGMLAKAERARKESGNPKTYCVAGAIVDTYNALSAAGKGGDGTRLTSWWRLAAE